MTFNSRGYSSQTPI